VRRPADTRRNRRGFSDATTRGGEDGVEDQWTRRREKKLNRYFYRVVCNVRALAKVVESVGKGIQKVSLPGFIVGRVT